MNLQTFLTNTIAFINNTVITLLITVAFVSFLWNAFQYFIVQGDSEDGQTKAKSLALWSIAAFVIIVSFWGIVNMIVGDLGFQN
jgi:hypothetical protein